MKKLSKTLIDLIPTFVLLAVSIICAVFLILGSPNEDGSITLDGKPAQISEATKQWIEDAKSAYERIVNTPATNEETIKEFANVKGLGGSVTLDQVKARRLPDGDTDYGKGWQCSKYTAYLATGRREYSTTFPDYGPVNGKDMVDYLIRNYGWKLIDTPVDGAIGSGGFNTKYGHTVMFLYDLGNNQAMVNDANWEPLTVSTHSMDITGWIWAVPGDYTPEPEPTPTPEPVADRCTSWTLVNGDTLGNIMYYCEGYIKWGETMDNYAKTWTDTITGKTVYEGWNTYPFIGLYAGHTIVKGK